MVRVRLYGWIAEELGWRERSLNFEGALGDLIAALNADLMELVSKGRAMVAVNHSLERDLGRTVSGDDIIALLPTFSGG